jgi:GalNAc-alpha-(1->4)-GalNAc-alpha-(1->3)-diNAcBac-PP-undecaprenol alpha-1,4-N-acetyl-D-galactosaminyltransferase
MKEKTKICLVIPSLRNGGSERVMSELANSWCKKETIEVFLILLTNQERFYEIDSRVKVIIPSRNYKKNIFSKTLYKMWILYFIRTSCKNINPKAVLSFNERYNNIVLLSLLGTKMKKFVSDRNNPYLDIGKINHFLRNRLYRKSSGVIAQTEIAKKVLTNNTKNKNIRVIHNPLREINTYNNGSCTKKKNIILNIGRNVPQKNQLELLEIFSQCNFKNWELKILGNGPLRQELINKTKKLNLQQHVQILDFSKDVDVFYAQAKIFAFTSLYEGFPNALIEAMAHGLPCVAYDCPTGPSDIIEDSINGFLVELSDKKQFQKKLSNLMDSEALRDSISKNSKKVKKKYSLNLIADKYFNFILPNETNY